MKVKKNDKSLLHRVFILFIILLLPTFFVREYRLIKSKKETRILPAEDFSQVELDPVEDKSFTFIVLTHNNILTIEDNVRSISEQNYDSYNVVYIDMGSTDGTVEKLGELLEPSKAKVIECEKDYEAFEAYYELVMGLPDDRVVIHFYGNDWLVHDDVLTKLAQSYSNPDVWLTYGQYFDYPEYKKGIYDPKPKKTLHKKRVQKAPWAIAPLKTFYAGLFKKLHVEAGFFLSIEDESAMLLPMAELSKAHVRFIPDVLFVHTELNQVKSPPRLAYKINEVRASMEDALVTSGVELIILSNNSPEDLERCLTSCKEHLSGVLTIHVIYQSNQEALTAYERVRSHHHGTLFTRCLEYGEATFQQAVSYSLYGREGAPPYVLLSTDQVDMKEEVALPVCIEAMRKTGAFGFYFHLGNEDMVERKGIYSWNIHKGKGEHRYPDRLQMSLYRRLDLEKELQKLSFCSIDHLIDEWVKGSDAYRVGLSFKDPVVRN